MRFHIHPPKPWAEILPRASEQARDLVSRLVVYESGDRITAEEVSLLTQRSHVEGITDTYQGAETPFL